MQIISHRGYWKLRKEQNKAIAFDRSFSSGFGIETDIRDYNGELVVSHEIPNSKCINLECLFEKYKRCSSSLPLALNIKADGLQGKLKKLIKKYKVTNYFVFDMSVPDTLGYLKGKFNVFTRQSEYEKQPSFYQEVKGVWLDCFVKNWHNNKTILGHIYNNKKVCLVSPELHKRDYKSYWTKLRNIVDNNSNEIILCTDFPMAARRFFYGR